jgi:hypothetical protein
MTLQSGSILSFRGVDDFEVDIIARNICESSERSREKALRELQSMISAKRYLIVLDDVWNRDADKCGKLKTCIKQSMTMGVDEAHNIEKLSDEHLREIVHIRAFNLQNPNSDDMDRIFCGILVRCGGSPLAAKAFSSVLSNKTTINEWKDIYIGQK